MKKTILLSNSIIHFLNDASAVAVAMIFPLLYSQHFIITKYSHIGILSNLGLFVTFLFHILITHLEYKYEYKHMLLFSLIGISASLVLLTTTSSFLMFLGIYLVMRFFVSFYHPLGISWISRSHADKGLDFAMGIQSGSGNLGVFLAFISVGYLSQRYSWKMPMVLWALVCFVFGVLAYTIMKNTTTRKTYPGKSITFSSWTQTIKQIKVFIPGFIFGGACWGTAIYFAPSLLNHRFKIPLGKTGFYMALWIFLGTIMTYLYGLFNKKFGRWNICIAGFTGSTLCLVLLGLSQSSLIALLSLFFFGTFLFLNYPALQAFVGDSVSEKNKTIAFSLAANIQMLSGSIFGLISGFLSDYFGINTPFLLIAVLGVPVSLYYLILKKKQSLF
ncbi:MAG: MFS transporter [Candidatus Aminicenantes bacterium]|nr:MFS transporter [Candidatus Aminicenantes bacterium]